MISPYSSGVAECALGSGNGASQLGGGQDQVASSLFVGCCVNAKEGATKMKPEYARRPHCGRLISNVTHSPAPQTFTHMSAYEFPPLFTTVLIFAFACRTPTRHCGSVT